MKIAQVASRFSTTTTIMGGGEYAIHVPMRDHDT